MSIVVAGALGYLIGSAPTANGIARMIGIDLRTAGSGNPGANNARRLGGYRLAALVLVAEILKGSLAVAAGNLLAGDAGMVLSGVGAVAGNVLNPWYRFRGGKGLGMTLGVLIAAWPAVVLPVLVAILAVVLITRSSGLAAIGALVVVVVLASVWDSPAWPVPWGIGGADLLFWLAIGLGIILSPKHLRDAARALSARR